MTILKGGGRVALSQWALNKYQQRQLKVTQWDSDVGKMNILLIIVNWDLSMQSIEQLKV